MTDYLSSLSSRSFDFGEDVGRVRPRLPSLFEPWQEPWGGSVGLASWLPVPEEAHDEGLSLASATAGEGPKRLEHRTVRAADTASAPAPIPDAVARLRPGPKEDPPRTAPTSPRDLRTTATLLPCEGSQPSAPVGVLPVAPGGESRAVAIRSKPREGREEGRKSPALEAQPLLTGAGRDEAVAAPGRRETGSVTSSPRADKGGLAIETVILKERVRRIVDPDMPSREEAVERESVITPQSVLPLLDHVERIALPSLQPSRREREPKPEPTIHVTIGRIEVRATTAPLQPRPKPRAPAPMSLDEYLGLRSGGGR
jgi:hypothetical protein